MRPNATRDVNRNRVRAFLAAHLGATRKDVARALGLHRTTVALHMTAIRAEWRGRGPVAGRQLKGQEASEGT